MPCLFIARVFHLVDLDCGGLGRAVYLVSLCGHNEIVHM